jgi:DNA-directed RNA polymerase specialized sigma24 family protein
MGFDNTIDNRWRPDLDSSQRRVREEEQEALEPPVKVIQSRELSFVPNNRRKKFEPHDAQTKALIAQHDRLCQLPHGDSLVERLAKWSYMDKMRAPEEKQRYIEPLIETVRRDPVNNEDLLVFLLVIFEPIRRSVSNKFVAARGGLTDLDSSYANRAEARMIREIDKQTLYDVSREAVLEAIFRYPSRPPKFFWPWLRDTVAHRALDKLTHDLPEIESICHNPAEAQAMQNALAGFDAVEAPPMRETAGLREWRSRVELRSVFEIVEQYFVESTIRDICRTAIGRLPRCQAEIIDSYFFEQRPVGDIASIRRISSSTVYNAKRSAERKLSEDPCFFSALCKLQVVRDEVRAQALRERYPDGRLPDGRRIVHIDAAA